MGGASASGFGTPPPAFIRETNVTSIAKKLLLNIADRKSVV